MVSSIGGSSSLMQSYMTQMRQQMFSKVDANGDGKLDSDELAEMVANGPKNGPSVDEILSQSDTDGDGSVSESEFEATAPPPPPMQGMGGMSSADFLEQLFSDADTNGDGVISEDEMSTVVANVRQTDRAWMISLRNWTRMETVLSARLNSKPEHPRGTDPFRAATRKTSLFKASWKPSMVRMLPAHQPQPMGQPRTALCPASWKC